MRRNLFNIELYGREWEPDYFRGKGVRGWWLRLLNRLRFALELRVQWHTLYILGRIQGADLDSLRQQFEADTAKQVDQWQVERGAYRLERASPEELKEVFYKQEKSVEQKTIEMLARLTELKRARRYRSGPRTFKVYEVADEDFIHAQAGTDAAADAGTRRPGSSEGQAS